MRGHRLLKAVPLAGAALALTLAVSGASPAVADTSVAQGYGSVSDGEITATAGAATTGTGGAGDPKGPGPAGTTAPPPPCSYAPADPSVNAAMGPGGPGPGSWYFTNCEFSGLYASPYPPIWVPAGQAPGAAPSVPALLDQAMARAGLVQPGIRLDPPGQQIVNYPSWLWVDPSAWHGVVAQASAAGVTATVTANPVSVTWDLGDGHSVTCPGPGVPYEPNKPAAEQSTYCSYTWRTSSAGQPRSAYEVTATIDYQVTTAVSGANNPSPNLGIQAGPSARAAVRVSEVEALGTS